MKITHYAVILTLSAVAFVAHAEPNKKSDEAAIAVEATQKHSVFKGLMYTVWSRLKTFNPKAAADQDLRTRTVATAGIRGSETTTSILEPYWKNDRTRDEQFLKEIESYNTAQSHMDNGELEKAQTALDGFLKTFPDSDLKPNAVFAKAMAQGGLGDVKNSVKTLNKFIDKNPSHPLVADAKLVISELSK